MRTFGMFSRFPYPITVFPCHFLQWYAIIVSAKSTVKRLIRAADAVIQALLQ